MGSSKRLRKQRWVKVFNLLIDNSRGYCLGDVCEEYEKRSKRQGKVRSIAWLCREVVRSRSYLISYSQLRGWFTGLWSKIVLAIRSLLANAAKLMLRPQIGIAYVASSVLFAAFVFLSQTQFHQRENNDIAQNADENSRVYLSDSNLQTVVLVPERIERSGGFSVRRISIDSTISVVRFDLVLPLAEAELLYEVTLSNLARDMLVVKGIRHVDNKLSVLIPASFIPTGDYVLNASPRPNTRGYSYYFRVTSAIEDTDRRFR